MVLLNDQAELSAKKIYDCFFSNVKRRFGQNFLFDEKINRRIVSVAGDLTGKIVAEIGPGPGGLTLEILKQDIKKLYVIEIDPHWSSIWNRLSNLFNGKLKVIEKDALKFDFKIISPNIIISNLPYNISTQLLIKWLEELENYENLILTFQKEVADRLYAYHSSKAYGKLSILTQWKSHIIKAFDITPGSFFPPPKVRSTVVKMTPYLWNDSFSKFSLFSKFLANVFMHRRKMVVKSLSSFFSDPKKILLEHGYNEKTRAEDITVRDYIKIMDAINN